MVVVHQQATLEGEVVSLFPIRSDEGLLGHVTRPAVPDIGFDLTADGILILRLSYLL